jgi:hypothetical protein
MEVHELKEWMSERFDQTDKKIEKIEDRLEEHGKWIASVKAVWYVVSGLVLLVIGKWEIWNRWWGGK